MTQDLRTRIEIRLQELANSPRKSRTEQDLEEAKTLLDLLRTTGEIRKFPKKFRRELLAEDFETDRLNDEIDDFHDPNRRRARQLEHEVAVLELEQRRRQLKGTTPRIPTWLVAIDVVLWLVWFGLGFFIVGNGGRDENPGLTALFVVDCFFVFTLSLTLILLVVTNWLRRSND